MSKNTDYQDGLSALASLAEKLEGQGMLNLRGGVQLLAEIDKKLTTIESLMQHSNEVLQEIAMTLKTRK